ncbi:MAG: hypothetical protein A2Y92_04650 [Chloroflexi bacterium RBG_13_57_8]|nr:MAG: hypothetical protein A2Y92_04650 [Chloroflexi bacterium RBG_13_57_8]
MVSIMLVDDHAVVRSGLRLLLAAEPDFQVVGEAGNGQEAALVAESLLPDIIVLELIMKGINGVEVTRNLCKKHPNTGIVVFSLSGSEHNVIEALRAGARGYVLKDSHHKEVVEAIRKVAAGGRYLCSGLMEQLFPNRKSDNTLRLDHGLTARERDVLRLSAQGSTCMEVASLFGISRRTVETHRANILHKLGQSRPASLYIYAFQNGMVNGTNSSMMNSEAVVHHGNSDGI